MTIEFEGLPNKVFTNIESYGADYLKGKIITAISRTDTEIFLTVEDKQFAIMHMQDCCEEVYIQDITGSLNSLLNYPITMSEIITNNATPKYKSEDSATWTFIKLATIKGYVTIRFYGASNGYYCEDAELYKLIEVKGVE